MIEKSSKCPECGKTIDEVKKQPWEAWNYCCKSWIDAKEQNQKKKDQKEKKGG